MKDLFGEIWASIGRNKLRTCLTGFAVAWGIFMLIVLLGAGNGVMNTTLGNFGELNTNTMEIWGGRTSKPYGGFKEGRRMKLTDADVRLAAGEAFMDNVDDVIPLLTQGGLTLTYGRKHFSVEALGTTDKYKDIENVKMLAGRFIDKLDVDQQRKVVIITHTHAKNFLRGSTDYDRIIGDRIRLGNLSFTIIGVRHG